MRVLLAEDEELLRDVYARQLAVLGHEAIVCACGNDACDVIRSEQQFDAVWTDLIMADGGGLQVLRTCRSYRPRTPVVVVSAYADSGSMLDALRNGAANFLIKPFKMPELVRVLERVAESIHAARREEAVMRAVDELRLHLTLPPDLHQAGAAAAMLSRHAAAILDDADAYSVQVALSEVLRNSIEHGCLEVTGEDKAAAVAAGRYEHLLAERLDDPSLAARRVRVDFRASSLEGIEATITDEGPGFEYELLPDPSSPEHLLVPSGRGLLVARLQVDQLTFSNGGRTVSLRRRRRGRVANGDGGHYTI
ncbi:MAG: response regulator [Candidatus Sumerlaeia bacterium]|nr:response regulator [Candidatus Sumerlaeia bacterium]